MLLYLLWLFRCAKILCSKVAEIVQSMTLTALNIEFRRNSMINNHSSYTIISIRYIYIYINFNVQFLSFAITDVSTQQNQLCCLDANQLSERSDNTEHNFRDFETVRDLTIRRLIEYWNGPRLPNIFRQNVDSLLWLWKHDIRPHHRTAISSQCVPNLP